MRNDLIKLKNENDTQKLKNEELETQVRILRINLYDTKMELENEPK